jgi:hypothetical protein
VDQRNAKDIVEITNYAKREWAEKRPFELYAELYMLVRWHPDYLMEHKFGNVLEYFAKNKHMSGWSEYVQTDGLSSNLP